MRRLRLYELLTPKEAQTILKAKTTTNSSIYSEIALLDNLAPSLDSLKMYNQKSKSQNFFPSLLIDGIINKYLEETIPRALEYRPLKKDMDRREAVRSFWSMISSELHHTWPKEDGISVVVTGHLLDSSSYLQSIVSRLGGTAIKTKNTGTDSLSLPISEGLIRPFSSVKEAVVYFEKEEFEDVVSPLNFDSSFLYK